MQNLKAGSSSDEDTFDRLLSNMKKTPVLEDWKLGDTPDINEDKMNVAADKMWLIDESKVGKFILSHMVLDADQFKFIKIRSANVKLEDLFNRLKNAFAHSGSESDMIQKE